MLPGLVGLTLGPELAQDLVAGQAAVTAAGKEGQQSEAATLRRAAAVEKRCGKRDPAAPRRRARPDDFTTAESSFERARRARARRPPGPRSWPLIAVSR